MRVNNGSAKTKICRVDNNGQEVVLSHARFSDVIAVIKIKYIIEIDGVNKDGHCHTCIGWLSKSQLEMLEEYKESEE